MTAKSFRDQFIASLSADDITDEIGHAGKSIVHDAAVLRNYPGDFEHRKSVRETARNIMALCDQLERLNQ